MCFIYNESSTNNNVVVVLSDQDSSITAPFEDYLPYSLCVLYITRLYGTDEVIFPSHSLELLDYTKNTDLIQHAL